jgi:hypothetical protein
MSRKIVKRLSKKAGERVLKRFLETAEFLANHPSGYFPLNVGEEMAVFLGNAKIDPSVLAIGGTITQEALDTIALFNKESKEHEPEPVWRPPKYSLACNLRPYPGRRALTWEQYTKHGRFMLVVTDFLDQEKRAEYILKVDDEVFKVINYSEVPAVIRREVDEDLFKRAWETIYWQVKEMNDQLKK